MCSGYYRYDEGYTPEFPGIDRFGGQVIHPQHWPEDLDYAGKRVVVIGSGATAVTLVPAMAETAGHVTMLQRSPTYIVSVPGEDPIANFVRRFLPVKAAYALVRWKNVLLQMGVYRLSRSRPKLVREADQERLDQATCRPATTSTSTSSRNTTPGTSACARSRTATSSRRSRTARPRSSPTGSRPSPRRGSSSSPATSSRPTSSITATGLNLLFLGGIDALRRRRADRRLGDDDLQGHDAQRRPQHRLHARLLQRLLDPESRPDQRVRLPPAQSHGRARLLPLRAPRPRHSRPATTRSSNSPPATSSAPSSTCPSRARATPGS